MIEKKQGQNWLQNQLKKMTNISCAGGTLSARKKWAMLLLGVVAVSGIGLGWIWHNQRIAKGAADEQVLVRIQKIDTSNAKELFIYSGEVRGRYESQLAFQVGGKIVQRFVGLGSAVKPGDALMQIDAKDIHQTVNIASAQVYSAQSQQKLAASNLERYRQLYEQNAISKAQYEQYVSAYEVASAAANQASAQYAQGENQLDYSMLRASKAGVISAINAETGQVVGAGQVVLTLVQDGEREVEINVPESRIAAVQQAASSQCEIMGFAGCGNQGNRTGNRPDGGYSDTHLPGAYQPGSAARQRWLWV